MLYDLPGDLLSLEHVKAAKKRVEEAKKRVAEDMQVHRDAKLALLRLLALHREQRTDASLQKVEQALARFAATNDRSGDHGCISSR
jgi:predicted acetyltransferase